MRSSDIYWPKPATKGSAKLSREVIVTLLGLNSDLSRSWPLGAGPTQSEVAQHVKKTPGRISQLLIMHRKNWCADEALSTLRDEIAVELARNWGVMTAAELSQFLLNIRGSAKVEPRRSRDSAAVLRCALEAESASKAPRFEFRRTSELLLVAQSHTVGVMSSDALFDYALSLGEKADRLSKRDPLLSAQRAREELEAVAVPSEMEAPSHERLLRLASAASTQARVASTAEIYPKGLSVARALKLASASLSCAPQLWARKGPARRQTPTSLSRNGGHAARHRA